MIRSMTGFGRASFSVDGLEFDVEIRTVNHRHLDVRVKLPRLLGAFDHEVKAAVKARLQRGKADVSVNNAGEAVGSARVEIDYDVVDQYLDAAHTLRESRGIESELGLADLFALPGVTRFGDPKVPDEALSEALLGGVARALDELEAMREREGAALQRDFETRLDRVLALVGEFEARSASVVESVKERLRKRASQLESETGMLDEARLHQEIVLAADRMDIAEELVRLRSHVGQFRAILAEAGPDKPVGRRLDFLLQEMGREANTVGSKGQDAPLAHHVVELKTELERIREQVQNLE